MDTFLSARCALFTENRDAVSRAFRWESGYLYPLVAAIYALDGASADMTRIRECRRLLKDSFGAFSDFRGTAMLPLAAMLARSGDPMTRLDAARRMHEALRREFPGSAFLPVAAMALTDLASDADCPALAARTRKLYLGIRRAHPFLTSQEDVTTAALLALSARDDETLLSDTEACYALLKPYFAFGGNSVQTISHILALDERRTEEKCDRALRLFEGLRSQSMNLRRGYELPALGTLALSEAEESALIADAADIDGYLAGQKGFGAFGLGKTQRHMYAVLLTPRQEHACAAAAAVSGVVATIIAQQAAICAAIAASTAASS